VNSCDIGCAWTLITGPAEEPITPAEAKEQARILDDNSNSVLVAYIRTAREAAEAYMGRGLLTQTWQLVLDGWANIVPLPMASPLQSITSVKYYDDAGVQQTLATSVYDLDTVSRPGTVVLKADQTWPSVQSMRRSGVIEITYVVGWLTPESIPERIRQGVRQYVTYLDLDRDGMEMGALQALQAAERCWSDRISWTAPQWGY
jgi:uncharacterized phiE125 gp8 family phage protein